MEPGSIVAKTLLIRFRLGLLKHRLFVSVCLLKSDTSDSLQSSCFHEIHTFNLSRVPNADSKGLYLKDPHAIRVQKGYGVLCFDIEEGGKNKNESWLPNSSVN